MSTKITDTVLYHFARSMADQWRLLKAGSYSQIGNRESFAVFIVESLCATLARIEAQEAQERRREEGAAEAHARKGGQ